MSTSKQIKALRIESNMTQQQFAALLGMSIKTLQKWEQGERETSSWVIELIKYKVNSNKLKNALDDKTISKLKELTNEQLADLNVSYLFDKDVLTSILFELRERTAYEGESGTLFYDEFFTSDKTRELAVKYGLFDLEQAKEEYEEANAKPLDENEELTISDDELFCEFEEKNGGICGGDLLSIMDAEDIADYCEFLKEKISDLQCYFYN